MRTESITADELVARVLSNLPRDPSKVLASDLPQLSALHQALAGEQVALRDRMVALAHRLENEGQMTDADLADAAREWALLQNRAGRLALATRRLTNFTTAAFAARGVNLADLMDGD